MEALYTKRSPSQEISFWRDTTGSVVYRFYGMKKLLVGSVGAIAVLLSASPARSSSESLSRHDMIKTMVEVRGEALKLCDQTIAAYNNPYTSEMCKNYSVAAPMYIKAALLMENSEDVYPHYVEFLGLSKLMSEAFLLDMLEAESKF